MKVWLSLVGAALTVLLVQTAAAVPGHARGAKSPSASKVVAAEPDKKVGAAAPARKVGAAALARKVVDGAPAKKVGASASAKQIGASAPVKAAARRLRTPVKSVAPPPPAIELEHLTTHASYKLRPDSLRGGFSSGKLKALAQLLRCHHTGKRHAINERLIEILYATSRHYHNAKLLIVAGYRAPKVARQKGNPKSPHKRGVACDFQVAGVSNEDVRDYLQQTYHQIGLGYYPHAGFVHVDVGRTRDAYWVDYSSPGQRARYSQDEGAPAAANPGVAVAQSPSAPAAEPGDEAPEKESSR